jgi:hypothetical protein
VNVWGDFQDGSYIPAPGSCWMTTGHFWDPHLPLAEDSGPIIVEVEEVLLFPGQWKFVTEE